MQFTSHTKIIFADNPQEAKAQYEAFGLQPDSDAQAKLEVIHLIDEEDFDLDSPFNFAGEVSLSPEYMEIVRKDPERAWVVYYLEEKANES